MKNLRDKGKFDEQFPTATAFRDHCYKNTQTKNLRDCNSSNGWCMECGRDSTWEGEKLLIDD